MRRLVLILEAAVLVACLLTASAASAAIADCIDATCRVTMPDGSRGSGCAFEATDQWVYVLTAAHVVEEMPTGTCEFWRQGHVSTPLPCRVVVTAPAADVAVVAVPLAAFNGRPPTCIPLAPRSYVVKQGETITSVGCANGSWSTAFKGHTLGYRDADLCFTPTPADGRSGSAVFDAGGTRIVGLLRARTNDGSEGIATSLQSMYGAFGKAIAAKTPATRPAQCGPDGCPLPGSRIAGRLFGNQSQQPQRPQPPYQGYGGQTPAWPTLPPAAAVPVSPSVDLAPIAEQLDRIAALLVTMDAKLDSPPVVEAPVMPLPPLAQEVPVPVEPVFDTKALDAAEAAVAGVAALADRTQEGLAAIGQRVTATETAVTGIDTRVKDWIVANGSLKEQFQARVDKVKEDLGEEATNREIRIAYLKDLITEKMAGGGIVGLLKLIGMPTGIIVAAWLISRRIGAKLEAGEPLLIQKLFSEVGELRGRIHDRIHPDPPVIVPPPPPAPTTEATA